MVPEQAGRARLQGGNPLGGSARGPSFFSFTPWPGIAKVYSGWITNPAGAKVVVTGRDLATNGG
jgi:hypothetical protein